jgi:autotransporter-associated beta strand protein
MRGARKRVLSATVAILLAGVPPASAAIVNWDANGAAAGTGGTGVWDTVAPRWENGTATWSNTTPDSAVFGTSSGTVTLGEAITAGAITVNSAGYVIDLSGSNLTVNGSSGGGSTNSWTITNTSGTIATYTSGGFGSGAGPTLSGNMNVVFTGTPALLVSTAVMNFTGTLSLLGATTNTFRSDHNGNGLGSAAGLIQLGGATTLTLNTPSGQLRTVTRDLELLGTGTSISVSGVKAITLTGNLIGSGNLRMSGTQGMLILAGENSGFTGLYTGSSAGWFVVAKSDTAFGVEGDPLKPISITSASGIGFMGDADGSINVGAKNLTISGGAHGDGIGNIHNFSGNNSYAGNIAMSNTINFGAEADSSLLLKGIISGSRPLQKVSGGTVSISGANTYTGLTTLNQGTLQLDFSQAGAPTDNIVNSVANSSGLALNGGTLDVKGKATATNQRFNGWTINAGRSAITTQNTAGGLTLTLGALTRTAFGGTVDLTLPTGSIETTSGTAGTILNSGGVAFATIAGTDWAAKAASGNAIVGGSTIGGFYTANGASSLSGNADMSAATVTTLGSNPTLTSLRFNTAGARTIDATSQTLGTGGILVTSNVGNNISTITGGILRGAANGDLVVIQNNTAGKLTIGSTLDNSGTSSGLTKSGGGTLEFTAGNTFTGATTVTDGALKLSHASALPGGVATAGGTGNLILKGGVIGLTSDSGSFTRGLGTGAGQVQFTGSGGFAAYGGDRIVNLGGAGASFAWNGTSGSAFFLRSNFSLILGASDADGTVDYQNAIALGSTSVIMSRTIQVENGSAPVDGKISGSISGEGGLIKTGTGTLELSNAANPYLGPTTVSAGTMLVSGSLSNGNASIGPVSVQNGAVLGGTGSIISRPLTVAGSGSLLGGDGATATDDLTLSGSVTLSDNSIIKLTLGAAGAHSSLTRTGGTWTFDSDQAFSFGDAGAAPGTYDNIIAGLAVDPGTTAGWTIQNPGWAGTFTYDGANIDLALIAVPEPTTVGTLLAGLGSLAGLKRFRRQKKANGSR